MNLSVDEAIRRATEHYLAGRVAEAEALSLSALAAEADNVGALHLCGLLAHLRGNQGVALALLEKAVRIAPDEAQFRYNLGVVYAVMQRTEEAAAQYRAVLAAQPGNAAALNNLGNAALDLGEFAEARRTYESLLKLQPDDAKVVLALAITLFNLRDVEAADALYRKAIALAPADARAHWEYAHLLLLRGDFARGWTEYEWRFRAARDSLVHCYPFPQPRWNGEPLAGKTILLHGEQGLGDEIMFASIYPEVLAEAGDCVIACQPHLATLFAASFPAATVYAQLRADGDRWTAVPVPWAAEVAVDWQIPAGSLPALRRRSAEAFPRHHGYLRADPQKRAGFAQRLAGYRRPRIGVAWQANPASAYGANAQRRARAKSISASALVRLLPQKCTLVGLQRHEPGVAVSPPEGMLDYGGELADFSDTAALLANLDGVITIDTALAHLAGAMDVQVAVLLPHVADWRWQLDTDLSPWYPSARLFRQPAPGDWAALREPLARWTTAL